MLTRLSNFLSRHEPITRLLVRIVLLVLLGSVALDFHYISLAADDIADRIAQMQTDISALRDSVENGDDAPDDTPANLGRPAI